MSVLFIITEELQNALLRLKTWRSYLTFAISPSSLNRQVLSVCLPIGSVCSKVFKIKESGVRCGGASQAAMALLRQ
jgi:hypothetical protein